MNLIITAGVFLAAITDPISGINSFYDILAKIITAVGAILLLWGIVSFAMAIKSQDASQRAQSIWIIVGGLICVTAPWIVKSLI